MELIGKWKHAKEQADDAFAFLQRMLELGADVTVTDHYGRNCLMEAVSEASNLCPVKNQETGGFYPGRPITPEMCEDLQRIFRLLIDAGATETMFPPFQGKASGSTMKTNPSGRSAATCGRAPNEPECRTGITRSAKKAPDDGGF